MNTKVQQHMKEETDINNIVRKYGIGQEDSQAPMFLDLSGLPSYHEMLNVVTQTQQEFMKLPSHLRKKFHHNPEELVDFISNPENTEEAQKLGLIKMDAVDEPISVKMASTPEAPETTSEEAEKQPEGEEK